MKKDIKTMDIKARFGVVEKYRAWDIRNKQMVHDALKLSETQMLVEVDNDHFNNPFSFFDGCVWMRFTGKHDADGNELYDGDIVEFDRKEWGSDNNIFLVQWNEEGACWDFGGGTVSEMYFRKKIGNIFENPELLERIK